jgi:G patch domain-containing protein 1
MDEEDLAELRESQKLVDTNDEMDLLGGTQAELRRKGGVGEPEKEYVCYTHRSESSY